MGGLLTGAIRFLQGAITSSLIRGRSADDGLGDRENRKRLAARAFLEGYDPDDRLFAKGPDDAPDVVEPAPLTEEVTGATTPIDPPVAPQLIPATVNAPFAGDSNEYIVREIERIDQNFAAIASALEQNAKTDAEFRAGIIREQRYRLARRGADRSMRRTQRREGLLNRFVGYGRDRASSFIGTMKGAMKEARMNLLAFAALKITDEIAKKFQPIYDSITEFFGQEKEEEKGKTGELNVPPGGSNANLYKGVNLEALATATGAKEGQYGSLGVRAKDSKGNVAGGYPLGRYQFMTYRKDARQAISQNMREAGLSEPAIDSIFARANSKTNSDADSQEAARSLLQYFPQETQDKVFRNHAMNTIDIIMKRNPNFTPERAVEEFGRMHLGGTNYTPGSADSLGTTVEQHGQGIREEYEKLVPKQVSFMPTSRYSISQGIASNMQFMDPIFVNAPDDGDPPAKVGSSRGLDPSSYALNPSVAFSEYTPLLNIAEA